jgi:hypothetical protein
MRISKLAKNMLTYLPVLAVLVATVIGVLMGRDLYPASPASPPGILMIAPESGEPCGLSAIYTSLPPKCKTLEGKFIPVPGTSPFILVTPEGK